MEFCQDKPTEKYKSLKRRHRNQRLTCLHIQESHKNTKLKTIVYMQRSWHRPMLALWLLLQFIWALLSCFRGPCCLLCLPYFLHRVPWVLRGERFDGDNSLRAVCFKVSTTASGKILKRNGDSVCFLILMGPLWAFLYIG